MKQDCWRLIAYSALAVLPEHAHHFKSSDRSIGRLFRLKSTNRGNQTFQFAVIGFNAIIRVLHLPMLDIGEGPSFSVHGSAQSTVAVGIKSTGVVISSYTLQRFLQKAFSGLSITCIGKMEIHGITGFGNRAIEI